jgi:hypothetical protein
MSSGSHPPRPIPLPDPHSKQSRALEDPTQDLFLCRQPFRWLTAGHVTVPTHRPPPYPPHHVHGTQRQLPAPASGPDATLGVPSTPSNRFQAPWTLRSCSCGGAGSLPHRPYPVHGTHHPLRAPASDPNTTFRVPSTPSTTFQGSWTLQSKRWATANPAVSHTTAFASHSAPTARHVRSTHQIPTWIVGLTLYSHLTDDLAFRGRPWKTTVELCHPGGAHRQVNPLFFFPNPSSQTEL